MSSASKEQRDAWEDEISQEVTKKSPEPAPKKEEADRVVNDDETPDDDAVKSVEKINTDKIDKEIADEVAKETILQAKAKADDMVAKAKERYAAIEQEIKGKEDTSAEMDSQIAEKQKVFDELVSAIDDLKGRF